MIHGWELALIIFAITVAVVNTISMVIGVKLMTKFDRIFDKSAIVMEKMLDNAIEEMNED